MKRIRIKGKALSALNAEIHYRDSDSCVSCGAWVHPGEKFHHEPCGCYKEDRLECGVTACGSCHHERHFGKDPNFYKDKIMDYLSRLYPEYWGLERGHFGRDSNDNT